LIKPIWSNSDFIFVSCNSFSIKNNNKSCSRYILKNGSYNTKYKSIQIVRDSLVPLDYNFWNFNGNGINSVSNNNWATQNIEFSDSTLVSDGVYEYPVNNKEEAEKAIVELENILFSKPSIAVRFITPISNWDYSRMPIIVGGRFGRWLKVYAYQNGTIKVTFSGVGSFVVPSSDVVTDNILYNVGEFNTFYLLWDITQYEISLAINDEEARVLSIPEDFTYEKAEYLDER